MSAADWSAEIWVYRPTPYAGGRADRVGIEDSSFDGYGFHVNHSSNRMRIELRNGGSSGASVTGWIAVNPPENAWYRMVMTKAGTTFTLSMYDSVGTLLASEGGTDSTYTSGFSRMVVHGGNNYFLDDVTVTGTGPFPPAVDSSPTAWDGVYVQPVTLDQAPVIGGDPDRSVDFSGGGVTIATHVAINSGARPAKSLSLWFDVTATGPRQMLWEEGGTVNGFNLYVDGGLLYGRAWGDSSGWTNDLQVSTAISAGVHHAALVLDATGGLLELYVDGASVGTDTKGDAGDLPSHVDANGIGRVNAGTRFHDGNSTAASPFGGRIDEVAVFNSVLSAPRVYEHYANGTG